MRKNLEAVVNAWESGKGKGGESCSTDGHTIYSYQTALLTQAADGLPHVLNMTYYSPTTSTQQGALRAYFGPDSRIIEVDGLPRGCTGADLIARAMEQRAAAL